MFHTNFLLTDSSRPLSVKDIVHIKGLIPEAVCFEYVDENKLNLDIEAPSKSSDPKGSTSAVESPLPTNPDFSKVLYFEFVDGDLKPKPNRKKG